MELEYVLSEAGHIVVGCAMDTDGAVRLAAEATPDVALVDINLRDGMSGPAIARKLIDAHGSIVVFLTANPEQIPEGFSGALGVLTKPFDAPTIRAVTAFAGRFHRERVLTDRPARLRLAPWLLDVPPDIPRH